MSGAPNVRWRSPRRRSNEKSAKQIRRELRQEIQAVLDHPKLRHGKLRTPPPWLVKGAIVNYHDDSSGPPLRSCKVLTPPFQISGQWCALIDKKRGWVPIEALTQAATTE